MLKTKSADDISALMSLSPALSELNVQRYASWKRSFTQANSRQAVLAFNGDVYEGLDASSLSARQLDWAQEHVAILSGLYGVLRPLDLMQPYRLEMGTRLETPKGKTLYDYWGSSIAQYLNERQEGQKSPVIVNLASEEYFKSVDLKALKARVVQCVPGLEERRLEDHQLPRQAGARPDGALRHPAQVAKPEGLQGFDLEGYAYDASASSDDKLVFRRKL